MQRTKLKRSIFEEGREAGTERTRERVVQGKK